MKNIQIRIYEILDNKAMVFEDLINQLKEEGFKEQDVEVITYQELSLSGYFIKTLKEEWSIKNKLDITEIEKIYRVQDAFDKKNVEQDISIQEIENEEEIPKIDFI